MSSFNQSPPETTIKQMLISKRVGIDRECRKYQNGEQKDEASVVLHASAFDGGTTLIFRGVQK